MNYKKAMKEIDRARDLAAAFSSFHFETDICGARLSKGEIDELLAPFGVDFHALYELDVIESVMYDGPDDEVLYRASRDSIVPFGNSGTPTEIKRALVKELEKITKALEFMNEFS